jgi:hypothetical protein
MPDELSDFLAKPSGETFLRLREVVIGSPDYEFHSDGADQVQGLFAAEDYEAVPDMLSELMPNWLLSPRVHRLVGLAAEQVGDTDLAQRETYMARACIRGLLESGDGSRERPFQVTHVADEYDLLEIQGKEMKQQRLVTDTAGSFDVIACTDGTELWFDIGPSLAGGGEAPAF